MSESLRQLMNRLDFETRNHAANHRLLSILARFTAESTSPADMADVLLENNDQSLEKTHADIEWLQKELNAMFDDWKSAATVAHESTKGRKHDGT